MDNPGRLRPRWDLAGSSDHSKYEPGSFPGHPFGSGHLSLFMKSQLLGPWVAWVPALGQGDQAQPEGNLQASPEVTPCSWPCEFVPEPRGQLPGCPSPVPCSVFTSGCWLHIHFSEGRAGGSAKGIQLDLLRLEQPVQVSPGPQ